MEKKTEMEDFIPEINAFMVKIYSSCDTESNNSVKVSQLIDFIKPFFNEELSALECLRQTLDTENQDVCVSSEFFYKSMNDWAKQISSNEEENNSFCGSSCRLDYIDKEIVCNAQSTPRASFGQKLLSGSLELLNLSNVSSCSINGNKTVGADVTLYEERIKMLQFEIGKCKSDMNLMKQQLTHFEEQNECLQLDLNKTRKKLHTEQLEKEKLVEQAKEIDEIKDELNSYRKKIEKLLRQKNFAEKENEKLSIRIKEIEEEREKIERKNEETTKKVQELKDKLYAIKLDLDSKETEISELSQLNDNSKNYLHQNEEVISCMKGEIEELKVYRQGFEQNPHSPSYIYKNFMEVFSKYPLSTCNNFSPPQRPITPPTKSLSSIPLWRARSTENVSSPLLETASNFDLRRQVLTKSTSATNNATGHLSPEDNDQEELTNVNSRIMETINQLEKHLNQRATIVVELVEKLVNSLLHTEAIVETKKAENSPLKNCLQKESSFVNDLWLEIKKLQNDLKAQKDDYNTLKDQYGICKADQEKLQKVIEQKNAKIDDITKQRDSYNEKYNDKNDIVKNQEALIKSLEKKIEEEQEKNLSVRMLEIDIKEKDRKLILLESHKERHLETKKELEKLNQECDENNKTIDKIIDKLAKMCKEDLNGFARYQKLENLIIKCIEKDENNNDLNKIIEKLSVFQKNDDLKGSQIEKIDRLVEELSLQFKENVKELEKLKRNYEFLKNRMEKEDPVKKTSSETSFYHGKTNFGKQQVKIDRLEEKLENALKRLVTTEKKLLESTKTLKDKIEDLKKSEEKHKEKDNEIVKLNTELSRYEIKLGNLENQLEKCILEIKNLQEKAKNQGQLENTLQEKLKETEDVKLAHQNLQAEKQIVEQRLTIINKETADLYANYNNLKMRFDKNQDFLREFESQNAQLTHSLMSKKDLLQKELRKAQKNLGLLKTSEMELKLVKGKVDKLKEDVLKFNEQMKARNGVLSNGRQELGRILVKVFNILRKTDDFLSYNENYEKLFNEVTTGNFNESTADVEVEVQKLGKQIKVAVLLLEIVAIKFPKHMELTNATNSEAEKLDNRFLVPDCSHSKALKRFTLRPPRLIVNRAMSPDSPCLEESDQKIISENDQESPDSDGKKCENWMKSFEESFSTADGDFSQYKADDLDNFCSDTDLHQPFPNVTDSFLEKLGLHETSELKNFSKEEMENLFTTLVIQLAIDSKDYQERQSRQKEQCVEVYDKMFKLLKEVNYRLRDHKCIGASDSIKPIFIIIEEARQLVQQVATSCAQYGVVIYEGRMTKCWNLVTNYLAQLRQEVQSQCTTTTNAVKMVVSPTQTVRRRTGSSRERKRRSRSLDRVETPAVARCFTIRKWFKNYKMKINI